MAINQNISGPDWFFIRFFGLAFTYNLINQRVYEVEWVNMRVEKMVPVEPKEPKPAEAKGEPEDKHKLIWVTEKRPIFYKWRRLGLGVYFQRQVVDDAEIKYLESGCRGHLPPVDANHIKSSLFVERSTRPVVIVEA